MRKYLFGLLSYLLIANYCAFAQYIPSEGNLKNRKEFSDAKFGIFIHWGIYSMMAQGEWYLNQKGITHDNYKLMASAFYPHQFNAEKWVKTCKEAGAKYICFTTRHHDGFSMFKTKHSPYNIVDATPYKKDIVKALAKACRKEGLKLFLYYSHLDWGRDDYYPLGQTGIHTGRTKKGNWQDYLNFMNNQLTELLTKYGKIDGIWFDGMWDQPDSINWQLQKQYQLIHRLQPNCLIANNHHLAPKDGEDFQLFERDLPGENTAGYSPNSVIGKLPLETCQTISSSWGYKLNDNIYKSPKELIKLLIKTAGKGANLLLNVGPLPSGVFPPKAIETLQTIGHWLQKNGETIYATKPGPLQGSWGTSTQKNDKLYLHILQKEPKTQSLTLYLPKVKNIKIFQTKDTIPYTKKGDSITLLLKDQQVDPDLILELENYFSPHK